MISYKQVNYEELSKPQLAIGNYHLNNVQRIKPPDSATDFDVGFFPRARHLRNQAEDQVTVEARLRGQGAPPSRQDYSYVPGSLHKSEEVDVKPEKIIYTTWLGDAEQVRLGGRSFPYLKQPNRFEDPFIRPQETKHIIIGEQQRGGLHTRTILKDRYVRNNKY